MYAKKNNDTQYKNIHFCLILPLTTRNVERSLAHGTHGTENTPYVLHTKHTISHRFRSN